MTFTLTGVLPVTSSGEQANNTVRIVPPPGTVDQDCSPGCDAAVSVPISALPITGPDLMAETSAGTALVAIGGLVLLTTRRRRRRDAADA